ncbi:AAA family ATPase [Streptomyces sp. R527F]|uniref:AAA family ATPase n=1 Tax=Streptomyces sp. R527F TaxID=1664033 RepID=UPI001F2E6D50|nr:AAA family ATPase [Streptomyces sp. R527F]UIZ14417.1 AAA family ATPase [Streptomyces sp. R527F]
MRILEVGVRSFKNLNDFHVSFDSAAPVSVLVGRNGAGKSNLLEALTIIFRDLDLGLTPRFAYDLKYEISGDLVHVSATESAGSIHLTCSVNGEVIPNNRFVGNAGVSYRPRHVFGYYSGPSNRLEEHFSAHQERFYRDLLRGEEKPLRPLFYARNVYSSFVLLAFFLDDDPTVQKLLKGLLGIHELDSVMFVMQKPSWNSRSGDKRFWNARGTVRSFLNRLYAIAFAPMRLDRRVPVGLARFTRSEHLFLYLSGLAETRALASAYTSNQEFFKALESTYMSELIHDVRIRVSTERGSSSLTFRQLSEGEQQLLLVLGLMRFTREEESLFLLDEPDTHLNPAWSVQYRQFLHDFGGLDETSHVLMATHDPLVVAGLLKSEVRILERHDDGTTSASAPIEDPRGMGVGNLLTSDVYGLRSQLDLETLEVLDRKRDLASRDYLSPVEAEELRGLSERLQALGLLMEDRDPEFQEYLRAKLSEEGDVDAPLVFSREEIEENRESAQDLLREVLDEGDFKAPGGE